MSETATCLDQNRNDAQPHNPREFAAAAHLRYVQDDRPGITREKQPDGSFLYFSPTQKRVEDAPTLERIHKLALPPAYTDVWICPLSNGHIQATARDARGRKQYRYHERWNEVRNAAKFDRMIAFGRALPGIRKCVERDLAERALTRRKVLAAVVRLLEQTRIRVGNEEYARQNGSFGLTTLRNEHVAVQGGTVHFRFRGKSGKFHEIDLRGDRRLARIVARCQELPGQTLFEYRESDGMVHAVNSDAVNEYLQEVSGEDFTAKDFRTWEATVLYAHELLAAVREGKAGRKPAREAVKRVAAQMGNTPAVCRRCYIHPAVMGSFIDSAGFFAPMESCCAHAEGLPHTCLEGTEATVLKFLEQRLN